MYFTDGSLYPENMAPLDITAAPYGPAWLSGDAADIAVTWDEQVQAAADCYNAGDVDPLVQPGSAYSARRGKGGGSKADGEAHRTDSCLR
jgi:hypothetical protein